MNRFKNPRLMMIFSMTIFGTLGVFVRNIPVSSGELALYRAVLATLSYYFAPVIVTVVCPFLFKEKLSGNRFCASSCLPWGCFIRALPIVCIFQH